MASQSNFSFENWMHKNVNSAKYIGLTLLIITLYLHIVCFGIGAGSLIFFIDFMTMGSLIFILKPLQIVNYKGILLFFLLSLIAEFLLH